MNSLALGLLNQSLVGEGRPTVDACPSIQGRVADHRRRVDGGLRETRDQDLANIAAQVRWICGLANRVWSLVGEYVEEPVLLGGPFPFACGQPEHGDANEPTRSWPQLSIFLRAHRAGDDETARRRVEVDGALDRSEHRGDHLPLVDQDGKAAFEKNSVWIGGRNSGLPGSIQTDDRAGQTLRGRGLARRAGTNQHQ